MRNTNRTIILSCTSLVVFCLIASQASFASYTNTRTITTSGNVRKPAQTQPFRAQILNCLYSSVGFTDSEINYVVSNYDVIIINWWDYASHINGITRLKQLKPKLIILVYTSPPSASPGEEFYGPPWSVTNSHEDWFWHDVDGNRLQISWPSGWYCMDVGNPEWRAAMGDWATSVLSKCPQIDGFFADNCWIEFNTKGWTVPASKVPYEYTQTWYSDMRGMLSYLKSRIGDKLLIPNLNDDVGYQDVSDGMLAEGFVHYPWWDANDFGSFNYPAQISKFKGVIDQGKYFLAIDGAQNLQSADQAKHVFYYSFCSFLLIAGEKSSFNFDTWWNFGTSYGLLELTKNAELLGPATGDYYSLTNCLARNFENGRVIVNYSSYNATVDLGGNFKTLEGNVLSQITLLHHAGVILYKI